MVTTLKKGMNVRLVGSKLRNPYRAYNVGKIITVTRNYIRVQFKNWIECFSKVDLIAPGEEIIQVKVDGKWRNCRTWNEVQPTAFGGHHSIMPGRRS